MCITTSPFPLCTLEGRNDFDRFAQVPHAFVAYRLTFPMESVTKHTDVHGPESTEIKRLKWAPLAPVTVNTGTQFYYLDMRMHPWLPS